MLDAVIGVEAANPVILIDGQSGAGKTTLAQRVVERWPVPGRVQSVALDSLYPGWDGLEAGVEYARGAILMPHARGMIGVWHRWDWVEEARAEAHAVDPSLPLIVEGSGLLTPATARLGDVRVWLESPAPQRRRRGIARDGETYEPHWDRWALQEEAHIVRDDPTSHATLVLAVP
ncbi:hypothetical protein DEA06_02730 [Microbacterium sp. Gd 4-13]|nr:hypothetical protein DEA06_02730 [Microbacterium sp. Gd 4-13]